MTRGKTGILVTAGAYNKAQVLPRASAVLYAVRRTIRTNQSVLSLCEKRKKEKRKNILQKEFPENVVAGRLDVCDRRATGVT